MNKLVLVFFGFLPFFLSCHSNEKPVVATVKTEQLSVFPVTEFLKGQLKELENSPVTLLKTITENGHIDSLWISRDSLRNFAAPFLTPVIDSANLNAYFTGDSFLDQTINLITLTYMANEHIPSDISLKTIDVYVEPQHNTITKIYLLKEIYHDQIKTKIHLTWKTGEWCSIVTVQQKSDDVPIIKEEKVSWAF